MDSRLWTITYAPVMLDDVLGQKDAIVKMRAAARSGQPIFLSGPSGAGKSCAAYALARELDADVMELNASDFRTEKEIVARAGAAAGQMSLFGRSKLILIDELDGISGTHDRGGLAAIGRLVGSSTFPVVLIANEGYDRKFNDLRKKCAFIEFLPVGYGEVVSLFSMICAKEGLRADERALIDIASRNGGDVRSALLDFQSIARDGLTRNDVLALGERDRVEKLIAALLKVFKTTQEDVARRSFDALSEDADQVMLWMDENLPKEYSRPIDIARAYERICRADIFRSRIKRRQHWRFLSYVFEYLTVGVALAKDERYAGAPKIGPPQRLLAIWRANQKKVYAERIAKKLAPHVHRGHRDILKEDIHYLRLIAKDPVSRTRIAQWLELDGKEIDYLS